MCNPAIEGIGIEQGRGCCVLAGCRCRLIGLLSIGEYKRFCWFRDPGHGGFREETAALQLRFLLLLQQLTAQGRVMAASLGKMPTTLVRRLISLLS